MPGTVKIWWHDGAVRDIRYHDIPVVNEPEIGYETVSIGAVAASSGPAPAQATVAVVECDVDLRYRVRRPGETFDADAVTSKPIPATGISTDTIGVGSGDTISFIEA